MHRQLRRDLRLRERLVLDGHFANPVSQLARGSRRKHVHAKSPGPEKVTRETVASAILGRTCGSLIVARSRRADCGWRLHSREDP